MWLFLYYGMLLVCAISLAIMAFEAIVGILALLIMIVGVPICVILFGHAPEAPENQSKTTDRSLLG